MEPGELKVGEIVQISPEVERGVEWFGACLMIVTEPKSWGAQGYVKNAGEAGAAYYRVKWADMERTGGHAVWMQGNPEG